MKFYKLIIATFILTGFWACSDYLDVDLITSKTTENYYSTPDEAYEALVGCYDGLQYIYSSGADIPFALDIMSDLCFAGLGSSDADNFRMIDEFDAEVAPAYTSMFEDNWTYYYQAVYRCNMLINNLDQVEWGDEEDLAKTIEGEARFLRAYLYLDMVRLWENIPLLSVASSENIPQADPDSVYMLITNDLLSAIENCSSSTYDQIASTDYGHATKWAAQSLLARAYLFYTGYYGKSDLVGLVSQSEALAYLEDVIDNSGYSLVDNYYDLWPAAAQYQAVVNGDSMSNNTYVGEDNQEVVFSIKYTYLSDYDGNLDGNHWMIMNGIRGESVAEYGYGYGWGGCTVLPEVYSSWDDGDDRKAASIIAIEEEGIDYGSSNGVKEYTGYFTKKYTPLCDANGDHTTDAYGGVDFMIAQYQDYFVMRFADVLLMAAELGSDKALEYVNKVHSRATGETLTTYDTETLREERKLEFAFEGIRYWDLLRYDNSLQYAADAVSYSGTVLNGGAETTKVIDGANLIATKGLFQIPNNQITLSDGVLVQNEGW